MQILQLLEFLLNNFPQPLFTFQLQSQILICSIKLSGTSYTKIMMIVFFLGWWDSIFYLLWPTFGCFGYRADNQKVWKTSRSLNIFHTADIKRVIMISFQFGNIQLEFVYQCRQNFWIQRNASIATKLEFTKSQTSVSVKGVYIFFLLVSKNPFFCIRWGWLDMRGDAGSIL